MKRTIVMVATIAVVSLASGCGGSQRNGIASAQLGPQVDQLLAKIVQIVGTSVDTAEPIEIGSTDLSTSENKEPVPLG